MREPDQFDATVSSLYETVLDQGHWGTAIRELSTLFDAPRVALFDYDFVTNAVELPHARSRSGGRADLCGLLPSPRPRPLGGNAGGRGEWLADEQMLDVRSKTNQEYVRDFALRSDIGYVGGCKVTGDAESCMFLSLARPPGAARFGEAGRQIYLALRPHLLRISRMQAKIEALSAEQALARAALDRLQATVVLVDRSRRVQLVNSYGFQLLAGGRALAIRQRRLVCQRAGLDERLGRLISLACSATPKGGAMRVPCAASTLDWMVMVVPVPQSHEFAAILPVPLAMVVVTDPEAEHVPNEVYRAMFSLTATEASLLAALVHGVSVNEWSAQRQIS